jgi:hypothetical protein
MGGVALVAVLRRDGGRAAFASEAEPLFMAAPVNMVALVIRRCGPYVWQRPAPKPERPHVPD